MARRSTSRSTKRSIDDPSDSVVVGVVRAPHGLRGEVRVEPLTDVFAERFRVGAKLRCAGVGELTIAAIRGTAQAPIVRFSGYDHRDAAETLRNKDLTIERSEARRAAGEAYLWGDLVGLEVVTPDGRPLGVVSEIVRAGEADVLVVRGDAGETMLPALESVIKDVDLAGRRIVAVPQEELT
jgi:16S rRNA processing protein RimM